MRAWAVIAVLLLAGCASHPKPRPVNYGGPMNADNVCTIVENRLICIGGSTADQQAEWVAYHTHPSIDRCEESALRTHKRVILFDVGTTATLKLACVAFAEGNPLGLPLALAAQPLVYKLDKDRHARTSRWDVDRFDDSQCGRDPVADAALVRAAFVGTGALAVLSVCL